MRRREFTTLLGGAAAWPLAARAQQPALPVIGILSGATFESMNAFLAWFYPGLESEGFIENRNFTTQFRWADDNYDRLPALASDLVRRRVDLIVALATTPGAQAAKAATQTIPIVFIVGTDPFEDRLVPRLARPSKPCVVAVLPLTSAAGTTRTGRHVRLESAIRWQSG